MYAFQLREWFAWCESNGLDPLVGVQRAHVELYIRSLGERGLRDSSVVTMMHGVRGFFRFAHIDGLISSDPAVYARLPKVHRDESRTHGLDRLELIRFLHVARTISVHHGALAYLLGINALRASEAAAVRIEDYADTMRGHRVLDRPVRAGDARRLERSLGSPDRAGTGRDRIPHLRAGVGLPTRRAPGGVGSVPGRERRGSVVAARSELVPVPDRFRRRSFARCGHDGALASRAVHGGLVGRAGRWRPRSVVGLAFAPPVALGELSEVSLSSREGRTHMPR